MEVEQSHVIAEANKTIFKKLNIRYFPYSAAEELFVICQHRNLRGITEEFLDYYMEPIVVYMKVVEVKIWLTQLKK